MLVVGWVVVGRDLHNFFALFSSLTTLAGQVILNLIPPWLHSFARHPKLTSTLITFIHTSS